jgi:phosphohistidine swiveling domain-containing protein
LSVTDVDMVSRSRRRLAVLGVYEALTSRRAVRGFTDQHVPREARSSLATVAINAQNRLTINARWVPLKKETAQ